MDKNLDRLQFWQKHKYSCCGKDPAKEAEFVSIVVQPRFGFQISEECISVLSFPRTNIIFYLNGSSKLNFNRKTFILTSLMEIKIFFFTHSLNVLYGQENTVFKYCH